MGSEQLVLNNNMEYEQPALNNNNEPKLIKNPMVVLILILGLIKTIGFEIVGMHSLLNPINNVVIVTLLLTIFTMCAIMIIILSMYVLATIVPKKPDSNV